MILEMSNITKFFPGVTACSDVSLTIESGKILGLIGENGAGKSTMMNILYGLQKCDRGSICIDGKRIEIDSPKKALKYGIGMVHQHFMLMPNLSVLQNIILGQVPTKHRLIDEETAKLKIMRLMDMYNLHVNLDDKIYRLSVGEKQRVEILKALYREAKVIILDEPTAVLTPTETDKLLIVLKELKKQGVAIVFITHKLREVLEISDTITVMRKGALVGTVIKTDTSIEELSEMMVGRLIETNLTRNQYNPGASVLSVDSLSALSSKGLIALDDISFNIHAGEIVGIAGVEGNGQTELIEVITGMRKAQSGCILYNGVNITDDSVRKRRIRGIAHIPEDRIKMGSAIECSIKENLISNRYFCKPYSKNGLLNDKKISKLAEELCNKNKIKTPDSTNKLKTLSGGNMQRVVIARELHDNPELIIASQPTRGVDIGAIESIHKRLLDERDQAKAILLVSAELDEIFALSDRIIVMYEGESVGEFRRNEIDEKGISQYMTGAKRRSEYEKIS